MHPVIITRTPPTSMAAMPPTGSGDDLLVMLINGSGALWLTRPPACAAAMAGDRCARLSRNGLFGVLEQRSAGADGGERASTSEVHVGASVDGRPGGSSGCAV